MLGSMDCCSSFRVSSHKLVAESEIVFFHQNVKQQKRSVALRLVVASNKDNEFDSIKNSKVITGVGTSPEGKESTKGGKQPGRQRGFGSTTQKSSSSKKTSVGQEGGKKTGKKALLAQGQNIEKLIEKIEQEEGSRLNIDPREASQGKVDFVRVEAWGSGAGGEEEVENLQLKSFSPAFSSEDQSKLFYEQLVRRVQLLESKGEISVVQPEPLPPFERWSFGEKRYLQYLTNQYAVHSMLEKALPSLEETRLFNTGNGGGEGGGGEPGSWAALALFREELGLYRSKVLQKDIDALTAVLRRKTEDGTEKKGIETVVPPQPTTQTTAYAKYIIQLGKAARESGNSMDSKRAQHHLLAHVFAIHVGHLSAGMRVGAKAVTCLPGLQKARAVSFYRDYPPTASNPLRVFREAIDQAGELVGGDKEREEVMEELPRALQKTSLLLADLAVEEKLVASLI